MLGLTKKCPFCGHDGAYIHAENILGRMAYWVFCDNVECEACGPSSFSEAGAIEGWETRPPSFKVSTDTIDQLVDAATTIDCNALLKRIMERLEP